MSAEEAEADGSASRLPVQLNRLSKDHLSQVRDAVQQIREAGLSEVKSVDELLQALSAKTGLDKECLPVEHLTSEYMAMNLWAWTPKRWSANVASVRVEAQSPGNAGSNNEICNNEASNNVACNNEASNNEACNNEACDNEPASKTPAAAEAAFLRRLAGYARHNDRRTGSDRENMTAVEAHARAWLAAMKKAAEEIAAFATAEALPRLPGDGAGCLFEKHPNSASTGPPQVLGRRKASKKSAAEGGSSYGPGAFLPLAKSPSVVTVHLGSEACETGFSTWQRFFSEHALGADGRPTGDGARGNLRTHFLESATGRYVPRCIFAAAAGEAISQARSSGFLAPSDILEGPEPEDYITASPFCREVCGGIRRQLEMCDHVDALVINCSSFSFESSALAKHVAQQLNVSHGKMTKWGLVSTLPLADDGTISDRPRLLFNAAASVDYLMEHMDLVSFYDGAALSKLATGKVNGLNLASPSGRDCAGLLGRVLSSWTSPTRLDVVDPSRNLNMRTQTTNMVPYPRIHFCVPTVGGLTGGEMADFGVSKDGTEPVRQCLTLGSMSGITPSEGKSLAFNVLCRNIHHSMAMSSVMERKMQRDFQAADWSPVVTTVGCHFDKSVPTYEVTGLHNTTAVKQIFSQWRDNAVELDAQNPEWKLSKFGGETAECIEDLKAICADYDEVGAESAECGDGSDEEEEE